MSGTVAVKAHLEFKEIRRIEISRQATLQELRSSLSHAFPLLNFDQAEVSFYWKDPDGDEVTLYSDQELQNAISFVQDGSLKLNVKITPKLTREPGDRSTPPSATQQLSNRTEYSLGVDVNLKDFTDSKCQIASDEGIQRHQSSTVSSSTLDQYQGLYTSGDFQNVLQSHWPNPDTCDLSRIKKFTMKRSPSVSLQNAYPVRESNGDQRGRVVIINNYDFRNLPKIPGSDSDATCLCEVFKMMKFSVRSYSNRTSKDVHKDLCNEHTHLKNNCHKYDMFILIIISHCHDNYICGVDGFSPDGLQFWQVLDGFNNLQEFQGKPKVIISEGCKRDPTNQSNTRTSSLEHTLKKSSSTLPEIGQIPVQGPRDEVDAMPMQAELKDTLFYAGHTYGSGNNYVKGSLMLQALKDVLLEHAKEKSLQGMIPKVEEKLRQANISDIQMPAVVQDTLTKEVFLV